MKRVQNATEVRGTFAGRTPGEAAAYDAGAKRVPSALAIDWTYRPPMSTVEPPRSPPSPVLWALVAAACLARLVFLDADPKFEYWVGYVTDEARWVETARNLALFGEPGLYTLSKLHLVLSPAHQAATLVAFKLAGVGFWTARLWPAACSVVLLVVLARALGRLAPGLSQLFALVVVGFEPLVLMLGRTALPEIPSLLFMVCALIALVCATRRIPGAALGGLLVAIAVSMKLTSVLVAPAFVLMILLSGVAQSGRERLFRLVAFVFGAGIPALVALAGALAAGLVRLDAHSDILKPILQALDFGSPYVILSRYFMPPIEQGNVVLLLLGAWACSWVVPFRKRYAGTPLGELYRLSGIWAATWFVMVGSLDYTPSRYTVHVIVPLAIHLAAGMALWRDIGPARVFANAVAPNARWPLARLAWLGFPAAAMAAAAIFALAVPAGGPWDRLGLRFALGGAMLGAFVLAGRRAANGERLARNVIVFTVAAALLLAVVDAVAGLASPESVRFWALLKFVALSGLACGIAWKSGIADALLDRPHWRAFAVATALAGFALQSLPQVMLPTYSIRDASRDLGRRFAGAHIVRSVAAGSLMLETGIPYRDEALRGAVFDGLVSPIRHFPVPPSFVPETTYLLVAHPRYAIEGRYVMESGRIRTEVYRNVAPGPPSAPSSDHHRDRPEADGRGR